MEIHLNGPSPTYPLTVPVEIQTLSSVDDQDHDLPEFDNVVIESGLLGLLEFDIHPDNQSEGEEYLYLEISDSVNRGNLYTLKAAERNLPRSPSSRKNYERTES